MGRALAYLIGGALLLAVFSSALGGSGGSAPTPQAAAASRCSSSVGAAAPAPARVPQGIRGFHSAWYGQSGTLSLCPGERGPVSVFLANTGTRPWILGQPGNTAYVGTWGADPGQDQPTLLGGNGARGSPSTGWAEFNRPAIQSAPQIAPTQIGRFDFTVQAPAKPGAYQLGLRPVIEGSEWMEDEGITFFLFVLNPDGSSATAPIAASLATPAPAVPPAATAARTATLPQSALPPAPALVPPAAASAAPASAVVAAVPSLTPRAPVAAGPASPLQQPPPGATLIENYSKGTGSVVQCADGSYSHSGGKQGACSHHGGTGSSTRSSRHR